MASDRPRLCSLSDEGADSISYATAARACSTAAAWQAAGALLVAARVAQARIQEKGSRKFKVPQEVIHDAFSVLDLEVELDLLAHNVALAACAGHWAHAGAVLTGMRQEL